MNGTDSPRLAEHLIKRHQLVATIIIAGNCQALSRDLIRASHHPHFIAKGKGGPHVPPPLFCEQRNLINTSRLRLSRSVAAVAAAPAGDGANAVADA